MPSNALLSLQHLFKNFEGRKPVIMLDYDGTLAPIVKDPNKAFMSHEMRQTLARVCLKHPTGIVSGRSLSKLRSLVELDDVHYIGSHGFDVESPPLTKEKTTKVVLPPTQEKIASSEACYRNHAQDESTPNFQNFLSGLQNFRDQITFALQAVNRKILEQQRGAKIVGREGPTETFDKGEDYPLNCSNLGAYVEDNKFSISVHYRNVPDDLVGEVQHILDTVLLECGNNRDVAPLVKKHGKKVWEVRPAVKWNKGTAVASLLRSMSAADREDSTSSREEFCTIFIGDDLTDEDVFEILSVSGQKPLFGIGICVLDEPRPTKAMYSLRNVDEVHQILTSLANL